MSNKYKILEAFGIELEYMIVKSDSLDINPISDLVLKELNKGKITQEVERPFINISNELVLHVIEFKNSSPINNFTNMSLKFNEEIHNVLQVLKQHNSRLMPGAMHPWMNPETEMKLWPHSNKEIYNTYNQIFNCHGHGWSNLQSMHINISFDGDDEFYKLHTAIRAILPLIPTLSSSSPIYENQIQQSKSNRLEFYLKNQRRIPSIIGHAIPDNIKTIADYKSSVLEKMYQDIAPYDKKALLQYEWLNSRAAIPKFKYGCIEIRIADVQEAPIVDLSIARFWIKILKTLAFDTRFDLDKIAHIDTLTLKEILTSSVLNAEDALISNTDYLSAFGINKSSITAKELLIHIYNSLTFNENEVKLQKNIEKLLSIGSLSNRILKSVKNSSIKETYLHLCDCLDQGIFFEN